MAAGYCYEHHESYDTTRYSSCYECYRERRSMFVDCIFCGKWHSPKFNTCFGCRQITDRDEAARDLRLVIMARDQFTCQYCGDTEGSLQVDHVLPCARGGTADPWNLQTLCDRCNFEKADLFQEKDQWRRIHLVRAYLSYLWPYLSKDEQGRLIHAVHDVTQQEIEEALTEIRAQPREPLIEAQKAKLQAAGIG